MTLSKSTMYIMLRTRILKFLTISSIIDCFSEFMKEPRISIGSSESSLALNSRVHSRKSGVTDYIIPVVVSLFPPFLSRQ